MVCGAGALVGAAALLAFGAGAAPDRPVLRPTHDADVTYALDAGGGATLHERLRWHAATQTLRIDPPTEGLYVIIDFVARRMSTVRTAERTVIDMAAPDNVTGMPDSAASGARRQGADTVAGLACTDWDMTDAAGEAARLCLTDDGVMLRARAGGRTLLNAETVSAGPIDPAAFKLPAGYTHQPMAAAGKGRP